MFAILMKRVFGNLKVEPGNTMHFPNVPDDFAFTLNLPMIHQPGDR